MPAIKSSTHLPRPAVVICFSGLDPTGGAGISADIEAITAQGAHCCPLISCHTVQNSSDVQHVQQADPQLLTRQATTLLDDIKPDAFKIGALGCAETVKVVANIVRQHPGIPVVLDPVISAGGGGKLSREGLIEAIIDELLPLTSVCTPNTLEALKLGQHPTDETLSVADILQRGCHAVLLTGSHRDTKDVHHQLYQSNGTTNHYRYPRLAAEYHGSGCTLASCLAALLAQSHNVTDACQLALDYCRDCLSAAYSLGEGQQFPNRKLLPTGSNQND